MTLSCWKGPMPLPGPSTPISHRRTELVRDLADRAPRQTATRRCRALTGAGPGGSNASGRRRARRIPARIQPASREGVILMCLAEALCVPDGETADRLIATRFPAGPGTSTGDSDSLLVNASTWGSCSRARSLDRRELALLVRQLAARLSEAGGARGRRPRILASVRHGPRHRGGVVARRRQGRARHRYSFDMLGGGPDRRRRATLS